jgi:L-ascorbate metabolism protein UlaG (beta-lactamase superfamily)
MAPARRLTWLGQAGFRLELEGVCIVVDPWTSPHELRIVPPPPLGLAAEGVDWLLVTHEHLDHLDVGLLPVVLRRSPAARVVVPAPVARLVVDVVPHDRLVAVSPGDRLDLDGVDARVVPAFHGVSMADAYGDGSALGEGPRFVGYALGASRPVYHAGDTIVTDALLEAIEPLGVEVALLPINGRDEEREARGIVGNMDAVEAVELALAVGAAVLVPHHWDGFEGNTVPPGSAVDAADGRVAVAVPARWAPLDFAKPS